MRDKHGLIENKSAHKFETVPEELSKLRGGVSGIEPGGVTVQVLLHSRARQKQVLLQLLCEHGGPTIRKIVVSRLEKIVEPSFF